MCPCCRFSCRSRFVATLPQHLTQPHGDSSGTFTFRKATLKESSGSSSGQISWKECLPDLRDLRLTTSEGALVSYHHRGSIGRQRRGTHSRADFQSVQKGRQVDGHMGGQVCKGTHPRHCATGPALLISFERSKSEARIHSHEAYVIRVDGLIVDRESSPVVHCTSVFHPLNNFQYLQIRILDGDNPPLRVDGGLMLPPIAPNPLRFIASHTDSWRTGMMRIPVRRL